jgi:hypothetical protein
MQEGAPSLIRSRREHADSHNIAAPKPTRKRRLARQIFARNREPQLRHAPIRHRAVSGHKGQRAPSGQCTHATLVFTARLSLRPILATLSDAGESKLCKLRRAWPLCAVLVEHLLELIQYLSNHPLPQAIGVGHPQLAIKQLLLKHALEPPCGAVVKHELKHLANSKHAPPRAIGVRQTIIPT